MWEQSESGRVSHPFEPVILVATLLMIPVLILRKGCDLGDVANGRSNLELDHLGGLRRRAWVHPVGRATQACGAPSALARRCHRGRDGSALRLAPGLAADGASVPAAAAVAGKRRRQPCPPGRATPHQPQRLPLHRARHGLPRRDRGAVQSTVDEGEFKTFWDGVWWAVVTVTTVGYGDLYPTTVPGRIVGMLLMLVGIGFLAVLTATISSSFVKSDRQDETSEILEVLRRLEADVAELKARTLVSRRVWATREQIDLPSIRSEIRRDSCPVSTLDGVSSSSDCEERVVYSSSMRWWAAFRSLLAFSPCWRWSAGQEGRAVPVERIGVAGVTIALPPGSFAPLAGQTSPRRTTR